MSMPAWGGRLALASLSTLVALLLCELGVRLLLPAPQLVRIEAAPPEQHTFERVEAEESKTINSVILFGGKRGVRLRPNTRARILSHSLSGRDVTIATNALGLRYEELPPKTPGEYRVLVLGDSITFGDYGEEDETYTRRLESLTRERGRGGAPVRFLNAGLPGAGAAEERFLFQELAPKVKADLVLVAAYLNDAQTAGDFYVRTIPPPWSHSRFLTWAAGRVQMLSKRLYREDAGFAKFDPDWREEFRAGRPLKSGGMFDTKDGFDFEIYNAHRDFGLAWHPKSYEILEGVYGALGREVEQSGARLALVLFPVHLQVLGSYQDLRPQESFRTICQRLRIPFLDLAPLLRAEWKKRPEKLYYDHCHYTPHGNRVVAQSILPWLVEEKLIP